MSDATAPRLSPFSPGVFPLHAAAFQGDAAGVRRLLRAGELSVDARDGEGRTALFVARSTAVVRTLLAQGASPLARDTQGLDAPAYWAVRPSPPYRPHDHAVLIKAWPHGATGQDWAARSRAAATMRPVVLRRELNRWGGVPSCPSPDASFLACAARLILETPENKTTVEEEKRARHVAAERLLLLAASGEDAAVNVEGISAGLWALVALHLCPEAGHDVRLSGPVRSALWRHALEKSECRRCLDRALDWVSRTRGPDLAGLLRVRLATSVFHLRGDRAFARLASPDAATREDERAQWLAWSLPGVLVISRAAQAPMGAETRALGEWASAVSHAAHARSALPNTPWGPLFWALGHLERGRFDFDAHMGLLSHLRARGGVFDLTETQSPSWRAAEETWRARHAQSLPSFAALDAWRESLFLTADMPIGRAQARPRL